MPIHLSQGKARPALPRSRDLKPVESVSDPSEGRGPAGRFALGNRISVRAGQKHTVKKLLGEDVDSTDAAIVARDAVRLFNAAMRTSPDDGPVPRSLWGLYARHAAVSAFYTAKADEAGLETEKGMQLAELALKHGQRAERLTVTALDVASRFATARPDTSLLSADEVARRVAALHAEPIDEQPEEPAHAASESTHEPDAPLDAVEEPEAFSEAFTGETELEEEGETRVSPYPDPAPGASSPMLVLPPIVPWSAADDGRSHRRSLVRRERCQRDFEERQALIAARAAREARELAKPKPRPAPPPSLAPSPSRMPAPVFVPTPFTRRYPCPMSKPPKS